MKKIAQFERSVSSAAKTATGTITIQSPGWSGNIIKRDSVDQEDRSFLMDLDVNVRNFDGGPNSYGSGGGGYVTYNANGGIVGISLEHFGVWPDESTVSEGGVQCLGRAANGATVIPAWGAAETDNTLTVSSGAIVIEEYTAHIGEQQPQTIYDTSIDYVGNGNYAAFNLPVRIYGNWGAHSTSIITTDLPIFRTDADLLAWIQSGGTDISKMLNRVDPAEEYELNESCWYIHNVFGHNTKDRNSYTGARNYKFYPQTGRICLYRRQPDTNNPYSLQLLNSSGYTVYSAGAYDENFVPYSGSVPGGYMTKSLLFGDNDYYTVFVNAETNTNIPIFNTLSDATDYINYVIDIDKADNYPDLAIADNEVIVPDFGVEDTTTPIGANEQAYNIAGFHLYEVSHTELSSFFLEIFDPDPNITDSILEGTRLFSGNEINAIMMCMFLPISDIGDICDMGTTSKITVGTWIADHSEGRRIASNDKVINMGEMFIPYRYNSEEDMEPYCNMFLQLPYVGTQQIQVSKYIGKIMKIDYAVSVADGSCKALIYADNILMDEFPGNMGCMRPISASDAAQYVSNIVNGIMGGTSSITGGAAGALKSGMEGAAAGNALSIAGAAGAAGSVAAGGIWKGYELLQAAETPPMSTTGALSGGISYFGVQEPHLIIAQKASVRPRSERQLIGYPSGQSGKVNQFSGYLKCSAFKLADGFTGTQKELAEIYDIMSKGIYL